VCGRFTIAVSQKELFAYLQAEYGVKSRQFDFEVPRYNVAPGQNVLAIIHDGNQYRVGALKWGLVPHYAKDENIGFKMINARSETLHEKPSFSPLLKKKRCLILADGFYEWQRSLSGKQPYRFITKEQRLFAMAGLYSTYQRSDGSKLHTCTIVTTDANGVVGKIHERMPVILNSGDSYRWLDASVEDAEKLLPLLKPFPDDSMRGYPVSRVVNSSKNETEACIEERTEASFGRLF